MDTKETKQDLCKTCVYYWQDFPLPLDYVEFNCYENDTKKVY